MDMVVMTTNIFVFYKMTSISPMYGHYNGEIFAEFFYQMNKQKIKHITDPKAKELIKKLVNDFGVDKNI